MAFPKSVRYLLVVLLLSVVALGCGSSADVADVDAPDTTTSPTTAPPSTTSAPPTTEKPTTTTTSAVVAEPEESAALPVVGIVHSEVAGPNGDMFGISDEIEDAAVIAQRSSAGELTSVWQSPSDLVVRLDKLEPGPSGAIVAVGSARPLGDVYDVLEQRRPVAYYSENGVDWAEAPITGDFEGRGGVLNDVVWSPADELFYAVGFDGVGGQPQRAIFFSSETGAEWFKVDGPFDTPEFDEKGQVVRATESGLIAIGSAEYAPEPFAMLWIYDVDAGWSRQAIESSAVISVFDTVDRYRECIEAGTLELGVDTANCPERE